MANLEVLQNIASLQKNSSETIMDVIVSEELLANANYPRSYTGTIVDSTSMPNTGQFRIQYIPYFAFNEGYAVQIAWGAVDNNGLWYRRSHGTTWQPWAEFATKADVVRKLIWMPENTSIDDVIETGIYKCTTWVTAPTGNSDNQGTIVCVNYGGGTEQSWTHQTFYSAHYNKVWTRNKANVDWTDWKMLSNHESETLTLMNGWVAGWTGVEPIIGRSGNIATITGIIRGGTVEDGTVISNIPSQYIPSKNQSFIINDWGGVKRYTVEVNTTGVLRIAFNSSLPWDTANKVLQISYII